MSDPITDAVARVRELDAKATAGPWAHVDEYADEPAHFVIKTGEPFYCIVAECIIDDERGFGPKEQADADLIAEYRTLAPRLADECERLRDLNEIFRETIRKREAEVLEAAAESDELRAERLRAEKAVAEACGKVAVDSCEVLERANIQVRADLARAHAALKVAEKALEASGEHQVMSTPIRDWNVLRKIQRSALATINETLKP